MTRTILILAALVTLTSLAACASVSLNPVL